MSDRDVDLSPAALSQIVAAPWCYPSATLSATIRALAQRAGIRLHPRCGDCLRIIAPEGSGHLDWCPFYGKTLFPEAL